MMNANELKASDPKRFEKEYSKWREYACHDDWWEYVQEGLKDDCADYGITVQDIQFNLGYSQSDYAAFNGKIDVTLWMQAGGYDVEYPALYVAMQDYGEYASISTSYKGHARVNLDYAVIGNTYPSGIFKHLDNVAWDELVEEQCNMANLEEAMQKWVSERCRKLYCELRDEYEHLTSEESFIESCECNEITFEENADEVCS
jgi:hypothetical protein